MHSLPNSLSVNLKEHQLLISRTRRRDEGRGRRADVMVRIDSLASGGFRRTDEDGIELWLQRVIPPRPRPSSSFFELPC